MNDQQQHQMHLEKTHPSGAEEWACPTCGRRFLMQWPPAYKKIVLAVGDEYAIHSGAKGDLLQMGPVQPLDETNDDSPLTDEWRNWLDEAGFDNWWDDPLPEN